ncbi:MAG: hypothetical protein ABIS18_02185 [Actinomycetota bacterium]
MDPSISHSTHLRQDTGQIAGWLIKLLLFIFIGGALLIETAGVLLNRGGAIETASEAAEAAVFAAKSGGDPDEAALTVVKDKGGKLISVAVDPNARTATVTVRKRAKTLFIHKIAYFKKFTVFEATETRKFPL